MDPPQNQLQCLHIATVLPVRRWRDVPIFLRLATRANEQLNQTPRNVAYDVRARFLRRHFYTYTIWTNRAAVNAVVRTEPHAEAVRRMAAWAGSGAAFVEWEALGKAINWPEGLERLKKPSFAYPPPPVGRP